MLPLKPRSAAARRVLDTTADDLRRYPGIYRNGETRIEIAGRNGRLYMKRGSGAEIALAKTGEARYTQEGGAGSLVFAGGDYLHIGGRSFARQ